MNSWDVQYILSPNKGQTFPIFLQFNGCVRDLFLLSRLFYTHVHFSNICSYSDIFIAIVLT